MNQQSKDYSSGYEDGFDAAMREVKWFVLAALVIGGGVWFLFSFGQ